MVAIIHQYPNEPFITKSDYIDWFKELVLAGWVREINDALFLYHPEFGTVYVIDNSQVFLHLEKRNNQLTYDIRSIHWLNDKKFRTITKKPPMFELSQEQFSDIQQYMVDEDLKFKDIYVMFQDHLHLPDIYKLNGPDQDDTQHPKSSGFDFSSLDLNKDD